MDANKCQECGTELIGRVDKKFCNDQCRNTFNNRQNKTANEYVRKVNSILRKNRRILEVLCIGETAKTTKEQLLLEGFNFYYYTNIYTTQQGKSYYFVYDYGYLELEDEKITLVKKKDYVK